MTMKIGAQLYTVRAYTQDAAGLKDALARVKTMGYDYVQLSGQGAGIDPAAIRDMLDEYGLEAPTTHISFDLMREDFAGVVKNHRLWGVSYPGVGAMPGKYRQAGARGFKDFARDASAVARQFKDEGMTFIYHNHDFEFIRYDGVLGYEILLNETSPDVQFELDTYWVQAGGGDPAAWIRRIAGRMDVLHLKDMQIIDDGESNRGLRQVYAEIGQGNINWDAVFAASRETGVRYAFVEQDETLRETPFASLKVSRDYLTGRGFD